MKIHLLLFIAIVLAAILAKGQSLDSFSLAQGVDVFEMAGGSVDPDLGPVFKDPEVHSSGAPLPAKPEIQSVVNFDVMKIKVPVKTDEEKRQEVLAKKKEERKQSTIPSQEQVDERTAQLPVFDQAKNAASVVQIQNAADAVKAIPASTSIKGRAADRKLKKTRSGVATFSLTKTRIIRTKSGKKKRIRIKVKRIPRLDIGEESKVSYQKWELPTLQIPTVDYRDAQALKTPSMISKEEYASIHGPIVKKADKRSRLKWPRLTADKKITLKKVRSVSYDIDEEKEFDLKTLYAFSQDDLRVLQGLILAQRKNKCHVASGIFYKLTAAKNSDVRSLASFHLGKCFHKMGLFSESVWRLLDVVKGGTPEYKTEAIRSLVRDLPKEFEIDVAKVLKNISDTRLVPEESKNNYYYILAKASARQRHYKSAIRFAKKVAQKSKKYPKAQYILSVAEYASGAKKASMDRQVELFHWMKKNGSDQMVESLVTLNLGRTAYRSGKYKDSVTYFSNLDKSNPLWLQSLVERGWSQIKNNDVPGAVGSMYSIQSPFFQSVYKPESYAVRTIGYINYCQYGDAYRILTRMENVYGPFRKKMSLYRKRHKKRGAHYKTVARYLKSQSDKAVDGLPPQVIREMGRHWDFLNIQQAINNRLDEVEQNKFVYGLVKSDRAKVKGKIRRTKRSIAVAKANIKGSKKKKAISPAQVEKWRKSIRYDERVLAYLNFLVDVHNLSRKHLSVFKKKAFTRLAKERAVLRTDADRVLKKRLARMTRELRALLDNNELLRFEIFSGSGENIRFLSVSGKNKKNRRVPASAKPKTKALQWHYDGEYWEDEIGNYKSTIKNSCRHSQRTTAKK